MSSAISLEKVTKSYAQRVVLDDLSVEIPEGSVVGLLGKNGAGKTTLLKCVLGLLRIDRGVIKTMGEAPWTMRDVVKARIGYVPQGYRPYPWLQAGRLIEYTASFYPHWNNVLVSKLVHDWEVDLSSRVGVLSEGELQKLLIILALGHEPELLVFDEPVASLDPAARRQFLRTVLDVLTQRAVTVFFSTHITSDLERVADTVGVLKKGRIDFFGGLDELKEVVKRVKVRGKKPLTDDLKLEGVLGRQVSGGEAVLTIRGFNAEKHRTLEKYSGGTVEVEDLNLEEIFLEISR